MSRSWSASPGLSTSPGDSPEDSEGRKDLASVDEGDLRLYNEIMLETLGGPGPGPGPSDPSLNSALEPVPPATEDAELDSEDEGPSRQSVEGATKGDTAPKVRTKAGKLNAKKKRRNERKRAERLQEADRVAEIKQQEELAKPKRFRLFSSCPIRDVSVVIPPEDWIQPSNPRHLPLSEGQQSRLRSLATEAAVDLETYFSGSTSTSCPGPGSGSVSGNGHRKSKVGRRLALQAPHLHLDHDLRSRGILKVSIGRPVKSRTKSRTCADHQTDGKVVMGAHERKLDVRDVQVSKGLKGSQGSKEGDDDHGDGRRWYFQVEAVEVSGSSANGYDTSNRRRKRKGRTRTRSHHGKKRKR